MREALRWVTLVVLAAAPAHARSLALVPFGEAAQEIEPEVRAALGEVGGVRLAAAAHSAADVEAARQIGLTCGPQSDECLVKLALFLRVDQLVSLAGTRTAEGVALELVLVDAALGRRAGAVALTLSAEDRSAQLDDAALLLLVPDQAFGVVALEVAPVDAAVIVDGEPAAAGAQLRLRAGRHILEVSRSGFRPERRTVVVRPATTTALSVSLTPTVVVDPDPPVPAPEQPSPWLIGGITVAAAGAAALVAGGATAFAIDGALGTPQGNAEEREQLQGWGRAAAVAAVTGVVVLGVGGAMLLVAE
ncbi:MAG: PEGA domain-containing protein [Deltaproteobacteria bacterium]|nr:PEGA domain-containing protein [Deltaproteobacteria bacterium]